MKNFINRMKYGAKGLGIVGPIFMILLLIGMAITHWILFLAGLVVLAWLYGVCAYVGGQYHNMLDHEDEYDDYTVCDECGQQVYPRLVKEGE